MNPYVRILLVLSALILLVAFSACAPVTYNRYQTADTLGKGNYKILAAATVGHDLSTPEAFEIDEKMHDRLREWRKDHPGNDSEINDIIGGDLLLDFVWMTGTGMGITPDVELIFAGGVHEKVDLEARVTATLYTRLNVKGKLADVGKNGALAIAPGLGYRPINAQDEGGAGSTETEDIYEGWVFSGEVPLIVGWKFKYAAPYLAAAYYYNHLAIDYTIKSSDTSPNLEETVSTQFGLHNGVLIAGVQLQFGKFVFTPEIAAVYTQHTAVNYFFVYPGVALGASW